MKNVSHWGFQGTNFTPQNFCANHSPTLPYNFFVCSPITYCSIFLQVCPQLRGSDRGRQVGGCGFDFAQTLVIVQRPGSILHNRHWWKKTEHICDGDKNYCFSFCRISSSKPSQCSIGSFHFHPVIIDSPKTLDPNINHFILTQLEINPGTCQLVARGHSQTTAHFSWVHHW